MQVQRQSLVQEQKLKMNPQLYQSIKLMELPIADLRERIEQELEKNPALEIIKDKSIIPMEAIPEEKKFKTDFVTNRRRAQRTSEEHRQFIEGVLSRAETLQEHLIQQIHLEQIDKELSSIAEILIQNLDENGFHIESPQVLFKDSVPPRLEEAMNAVRSLEPAGCCTSDYHESLKVQITLLPDDNLLSDLTSGQIDELISHLELVEREKYSVLAKKIGTGEADAREICEEIKKLSPFPGRGFATADVRYVIPDLRLVRNEDGFSLVLNDEAFPVLGVNKFYRKLSKSAAQEEARDFVKENIKSARLFIDHLNRRNQTLLKVANAILEFQREFFLNGPKHLAPLTLADIARELDYHETTISRAANGKYIQTEWGIFEIRYFFTNSISGAGSGGSNFSKESVKLIIKEILSSENRLLSDQEISALLSQKGIALARRTVAKYRKELDMGSSYTRKILHK